MTLQSYQFVVEHRAGTATPNGDGLLKIVVSNKGEENVRDQG